MTPPIATPAPQDPVPLLVVDADSENRAFWAGELAKYGFSVQQAESQQEALAVLRSQPVKAVIVDLELSRRERGEFLDALQSEDVGNPYVFLLVAASAMSRAEGYALGATSVLAKPVLPQFLVSWLRGVLVPGPTRWRAGRVAASAGRLGPQEPAVRASIRATLPQLRLGRGGFSMSRQALSLSDVDAPSLLEGDTIEFSVQIGEAAQGVTPGLLRGTGIVRYIKLDETKRRQQAWGIEFETLDEGSVDYVLSRTSLEKPRSYIPS